MDLLATFLLLILAVWTYMTLAYVVARLTDRTDVVDTAWGLGFVVVGWLAWLIDNRQVSVSLAVALFVTLWGVRLAAHLTWRNSRRPEDHRYAVFRKRWGDSYWLQAYFRIFLLQGGLLLLISLPLIGAAHATRLPIEWLAAVGFLLWAFGIVFEGEADAELSKFMKTKRPGEIMQSGLWRYSRHPNYFGEVTTWWGAGLVSASMGAWWGLIGSAAITILILKVSGIPPLEAHYQGSQAYERYKRRTSVFIPLPPKT